jgi:NitT/TauT family transport system permease protein
MSRTAPILTFVLLFVVWEAVVYLFSIPVYLLPDPYSIFVAGYKIRGFLLRDIGATLLTIVTGFSIAALIALPLGILVSAFRFGARAVYPLLIFTHAIPIVAIAPVIAVVVGTGMPARLVICVLIAFFPITVATATGILQTSDALLDLGRATGASLLDEMLSIRLPNAVPFIFGGLRIGISAAVVGTVVGEFVTANEGLGYEIIQTTANFNIPTAAAAVILVAVINVILFQGVSVSQKILFPWSVRVRQ